MKVQSEPMFGKKNMKNMKKIISLSVLLIAMNGFAQQPNYATNKYTTNDKSVTVYTTADGSKNRLPKHRKI